MFKVEMFRDVAYFGDRLKVAKFEDYRNIKDNIVQ